MKNLCCDYLSAVVHGRSTCFHSSVYSVLVHRLSLVVPNLVKVGRIGNGSTFQRCFSRSDSAWVLLSGCPSLLTAPARVVPAQDRIPVTVFWMGNTLRQRNKNEWIVPVAGFAGGGVLGELLWGNRLSWCSGQAPAMLLEGQGGSS